MNFEQFHPIQVLEEVVMFDEWLDGRKVNNILDLGCGRGGMGALMAEHVSGNGLVVQVDINPQEYFPVGFLIQADAHTYSSCTRFDAIFVDLDYCNEKIESDFARLSQMLADGGFIAFHDIDPRHALMQTAPCNYLKLCHSTGWEHVEFIAPGDTPGIDYNNRNELWEMGRLLMNDPEAYRKKYNMLGLPKRLGGIGVLIKP